MESDSAVSLSPATPLTTPQPPSAFPASGASSSAAAANGETKELEEYETASDSEIDDSDAIALTEVTLSPEKSASTLYPAMGDQNPVSGDEGEVHGSDQERLLGVSSDSAENSKDRVLGVGEKKEEESINPIVGDDSSGGEDAESSRVEKDENLEPKEAEEYDSNDTAVEPSPVNVESKGIETSESGVPNSAASLNQSSFEEVEPRNVEAESTAVSIREVGAAGSADTEEGVGTALDEEKKSVNPEEVVPTDSAASFNQTASKEVEPKGIDNESITVETGEVGAAGEADTGERFGVALDEEDESVSPEEVVRTDSAASSNPTASQEVEPKGAEAESVTVASNEVGDASGADTQEGFGASIGEENSVNPGEVVPTNGDALEHNIVVAAETDVDGADKAEPPVADVNTGESIDAGDELGAVVEDERKSVNLEEVGAIGEADHDLSIGAEKSLNNEAPGLNSIESKAGTVVAEKGEGLIESPAPVDSEVSKNTGDKLDQMNYSEISERSASMNQEFSDEKVVVGSEHASTLGKGEHAHQLAADDDQVETLHVIEKKAVVVDENAKEGAAESLPQVSDLDQKVEPDADESRAAAVNAEKEEVDEDEDGITSNRPARVAILDSTEAAKQIIKEMERISSSYDTGLQGNADGQIVSDSSEAVDSDEDGDGEELFDSAALTALLKAATGASDGTVTVNSQDTARIFSVDRPAGLGSSVPSMRPAAPRSIRPSLYSPSELAAVGEPDQSMNDDEKKLHEKVEQIRVKFLRLVQRLGQSPDDTVAAQVLYRLGLAEGIRRGRQASHGFSIDTAKKQAQKLEEEGKDDLDFSCNILVLGKTGVGKSATINTIFGEERSHTDPFQLATTSVREISGVVDGVRIRVIDTPGLKASIMDQATNRKILASIKKYTKKCPPDIVLYVDRMDTQTRDFNDLPLLRSIASTLGSSIWFNAIVALTHAASAPPDGPNGSPLGYEVFIAQRSHVVQQSIRQAAGDMRLMNPVALVENHPSCRRNREGERVLPNGLSWRLQLLLLCYSSKILSEANSLLKLQDPSPGKLFGFRLRSPPLPFLLSSLLQSRAHPKLSGDQGGDNADSDIDLDDLSDAEQDEEEDEYDQLPPFKPLRKSQIDKLSKEQRKAYFDEYDYRVKLLQKKQWKEELRRLKEIKKKGNNKPDDYTYGDMPEDYDQDGGPAAVQVPLPDMVLPPSFDCDNPVYRYRFLEPTSQLLTRPVLDAHGWDHDCGYDGVSIEESLAIAGRFPTSLAVQITKDKKEFNIHLDSSVAAKHGENGSTFAGFDIQTVGKQLAYILRGETKFKHLKKNKTAAGISVTFLGETVATGLKVEDRVSIGKRLGLVASTGAVRAQGDVAFGANLEARLRDKDYPFGQGLSTLGLSLMKWRGDLALGANLQSQFSVGRNSKMAVRLGLNNKLTGQVTVRTTTSEQLQIALAGILPLAVSIYKNIRSNDSYLDH